MGALLLFLLIAVVPATALTPALYIAGFAPQIGSPSGGEIVTIQGYGFAPPVRVFFDKWEAFVVNVSYDTLSVVTPSRQLGGEQMSQAAIKVIVSSGTVYETSFVAVNLFTYQPFDPTPNLVAVSPNTAAITGGTRVTIFGEGFQAPLQVFFGQAGAQILSVSFRQVVVVTPPGDTFAPVPIRIVNFNTGKEAVMADAFRYRAPLQIQRVTPLEGACRGGTRLTIQGLPFNAPVSVVVAGIPAMVVSITSTQIVAITGAVAPKDCRNLRGPVIVTDVDTGDQAQGPDFEYGRDRDAEARGREGSR